MYFENDEKGEKCERLNGNQLNYYGLRLRRFEINKINIEWMSVCRLADIVFLEIDNVILNFH